MIKHKKLIWTHQAENSLRQIYEYIKQDSPKSAKKVVKQILSTAKGLTRNPEMYQIDEYYPDNPGNNTKIFQLELPDRLRGQRRRYHHFEHFPYKY